jgi:predicted transcriptional regulator
MRTVSVKLPPHLDRALTDLAARRGESRSTLIREALEVYVREDGGTFGAAARGLAGAIEGPPDLSTAPEHMRDYGR